MAKKEDKRNETNKEKILSCLLEGPKTTTELLLALGYEKREYNNISKDLSELKSKHKFIIYETKQSEKINSDCKLWSIVPNYENFKNMSEKYPQLLEKMYKNDLVINNILEASESSMMLFDSVKGVHVKCRFPIPEEIKEEIKEKIRLSPTFFRRCFSTNIYIPDKNVRELEEFIKNLEIKSTNTENKRFSNFHEDDSDYSTMFKVCVYYDILNGQSNEEAKEHLINEQEKVIELKITLDESNMEIIK